MFGRARIYRSQFEHSVMPLVDALYGTAIRLTRNERDAEDLVQDTLLRAYRFWHKFEQGTNCKAWVFKILSNTFINRYHKEKRANEVQVLSPDDSGTMEILSAEADTATRDPEGALASRMFSEDVQRALEALPADFRLAVLLCDLEEFSYREIADMLEVPIGTVMSRLYRGRRLLQRALHDYAVEQGIIKKVSEVEPSPEAAPAIDFAAYRQKNEKKKKGTTT
jgi:RNA polymerase sigma-70 factor (ECF subfamily)